ncbi:hypothetical protein ACFXKF_39435 [Streptomyces scopuliridis]|uniref:hypothetical protein n=1 Tax=Streptomyces scopuliridis TaxID=452529 RepID=UPI0036B421EA
MYEPNDVTVELDGLGRQLGELPSDSGSLAEEPEGPVFVDSSGRRSRKLRRAGWVVAAACACYAMTLVVSVIGGNSSAPWLQIPGRADDGKSDMVELRPTPAASASVSASPGAPAVVAPTKDSNGPAVPGTSGSVSTGASDRPGPEGPGASQAVKPPKASAGAGGTTPDPDTPPAPGGAPSGGPSQPQQTAEPGPGSGPGSGPGPGTEPADPSPPAESPPGQEGEQPVAGEGTR